MSRTKRAAAHGAASEPKRRQSGERRIESLLAAAEQIFAESGYDNATTNHIAERAGASPGTLYQFFPNKRSVAERLAQRYARELSKLQDHLFRPSLEAPLLRIISRAVDALVDFHRRRPAFEAIFTAATISPELRRVFLDDVLERFTAALLARAPGRATRSNMSVTAEICIMAFRGTLPLLNVADSRKRTRVVRELKALLHRYLEPVLESQ